MNKNVRYATQFKKDFKLCIKRGYNMQQIKSTMIIFWYNILANLDECPAIIPFFDLFPFVIPFIFTGHGILQSN